MYALKLENVKNRNLYEELIKLFLPPSRYRIFTDSDAEIPEDAVIFREEGDKDEVKRQIYQYLNQQTGLRPKWGILTGIRPVKLAGELCRKLGSEEAAENYLQEKYYVNKKKTELLLRLYRDQQRELGVPEEKSAGIYIGIPFCPTRCLYCSFTSNQADPEEMERYLEALFSEIAFVGRNMRRDGIFAESIYIGGGTPTSLDAGQLERLLSQIRTHFDLSRLREFTVEAGRPDTVTQEKLEVLRSFGVDRISINPQSMHDKTLETIGRSHSTRDTLRAFVAARKTGGFLINMDLIAGLPGETTEDFEDSLRKTAELMPDNITLHTLAVKRSSRLKEMDEHFHYRFQEQTEEMLEKARAFLTEKGWRPYYLYRQKHTAGSTENLGYCRDHSMSVYNVRIMEEAQSIIALGAGGITKVYYPRENRLERVPNVSNYEIYIERIEEMLERKRKNLFRR